jgi:hypothetical protein
VKLCPNHRVMRMQPLKLPGLLPHFRLLAFATAGRASEGEGFALDALREHEAVHLALFCRLEARGFRFESPLVEVSDVEVVSALLREAGVDPAEVRREVRTHDFFGAAAFLEKRGLKLPQGSFEAVEGALRSLPRRLLDRLRRLEAAALEGVRSALPRASFRFDFARLEGLGYYAGPCLRVSAVDAAGQRMPLSDGGALAWTQMLLCDARERFFTSGMGSDLVCARFRVDGAREGEAQSETRSESKSADVPKELWEKPAAKGKRKQR